MFAAIIWALFALVGLALAVWAFSPAYRWRAERPKYRFLQLVRELDDRRSQLEPSKKAGGA